MQGVGDVNIGGSSQPAVRVEVSPFALNRFGISLEDVRLAVDEVAGMLVAAAVDDSEIRAVFTPHDDGRLDIALTAETATGTLPATDTFAWAVLTALVDDITATVDAVELTVVLRTSRSSRTVVA